MTDKAFRHLFTPPNHYRLLLAIDNDDNAPAAIQLTAALATRGAEPLVLRTIDLMAPATGGTAADTAVLFTNAALGADVSRAQENIVRYIIRETLEGDSPWPIKTIVGEPSSAIAYAAGEESAELVLMGIHRHSALEQALGENTATSVMSKVRVPVLGVRAGAARLPRLIMVATDFGSASWEAAHLAANLADPGGTVILTHVALRSPVIDDSDEGAALVQREGIQRVFERLTDEIKAGKSIDVKSVTREGDAGTELLAAAELMDPDLIAMASQRHGLLTRLLVGSVSRTVVRDGRWSMLVTPPLDAR